MTETTTADQALAITPEAAKEERMHLMADGAWRARAMVPGSREFANLQQLDMTIAGVSGEPEAEVQSAEQLTFERPDTPASYEFDVPEGADAAQVQAWRDGMHAAGVDTELASIGWQIAVHAAREPLDVAAANRMADQAESKLRVQWQGDYESRLATANDEAKRLHAALPQSLTHGRDYKTFIRETGLANSAAFIQMLHQRAAARGQRAAGR